MIKAAENVIAGFLISMAMQPRALLYKTKTQIVYQAERWLHTEHPKEVLFFS